MLWMFLFFLLSKCILASEEDYKTYNLVEGLPTIRITTESENIGCTWKNGNVYDKAFIHKFYVLLKNHNNFFVVIDCGAQTGCFSLLSNFFPNSQWYSFEPIKEAANNLKQNLTLNNIKNVTVINKAVLNFEGDITLHLPEKEDWGLATIGSKPERFNVKSSRVVRAIMLDKFVENNKIKQVNFIKIDTEGSELFILQGARNMIMRDHPIIVMEYNPDNMKQCGVQPFEINNLLTEMGYTWKFISGEDILCVPCL